MPLIDFMNSPEHLKDLAHRERCNFSYFYAAQPRRTVSSKRRSKQFGAESISSLRLRTPVSQRSGALPKIVFSLSFAVYRNFNRKYAPVL
jgi:hypothetical protein